MQFRIQVGRWDVLKIEAAHIPREHVAVALYILSVGSSTLIRTICFVHNLSFARFIARFHDYDDIVAIVCSRYVHSE